MPRSELIPFVFDGRSVRVVEDEEGNPWFVAKDVCLVLELGNVTEATRSLDEDERSSFRNPEVTSSGGNPNLLTVSESGLYALIFRSRKPEARWRGLTSWQLLCFSIFVSLTRAFLLPKSEDFFFEPFGNHFYDSCAYWLQTPHVVRHGGGLVTADKSGAFFVLNVKFTRRFVMSDSPLCGSNLAVMVSAQLGVLDALFTYRDEHFSVEDIGNVAMVIRHIRVMFDDLMPYVDDMPPARRFLEGGSHAQQ